MHKARLEAFSDGVIAIIITIMVLELKVPHRGDFEALLELRPIFFSYVLSFVYVAIYWNNHHHLMQLVQKVNGSTLWANMHLLFWLSLIPFSTAWMGENGFSSWPVGLYGLNLLLSGVAYFVLSQQLVSHHGKSSQLAKAIGEDRKGKLSVVFYVIGIALTPVQPLISYIIYIGVALMWLVPDRRIEKVISAH